MRTTRRPIRWILTSGLLVCVGMSSVWPRVIAAADAAPVPSKVAQGQKVCCCGTLDGRCCGMACCQLPNPKQDKAPASPNQSDDRGQPLGMAPQAAQISGTHTIGVHGSVFSECIVTGGRSLVSLSIRLNI